MMDKKVPASNMYSVHFGMNEYFRRCITSAEISQKRLLIAGSIPRIQVGEPLFLFVSSGKGQMTINHLNFKLSRGSLFLLSPFHNYTVTAEPDSSVELYSCSISSGLYLYILACPYIKMRELFIPQEPIAVQISDADSVRAEKLFESIIQCDNNDYFDRKASFMYVMELLGMLIYKL